MAEYTYFWIPPLLFIIIIYSTVNVTDDLVTKAEQQQVGKKKKVGSLG